MHNVTDGMSVEYSRPYPSWNLDESNGRWYPPVDRPDDGLFYEWNEESLSWIAYGSTN